MSKKPRILMIACSWMLLIILTACGSGTPEPTPSPTVPPAVPVSIQLSWVHTIEFAGFQIAERDGLYAQNGIQADLRPAFNAEGQFVAAVASVIAGEADFGVASSYDVMRARAEGHPLVAIAAIYQRSPIALISLKENNIVTPQDLIGKRVTVSGSVAVYFNALLKSVGIDSDAVSNTGENTFSMEPLLSGEIDAYGAYITNQPSVFTRQGIEYNLIVFADYAIDGYSNVIFTTEDMINNQPEVVEAFLRATFSGFKTALDNPEDAAALSLKYNPDLIYEDELANMLVSVPLLYPTGSEIGMMTDQLWQLGDSIMTDADQLPADFDVSQVYTLAFLNKIYGR
jgi:NitT/TauT family transport system substrate-binding protein